MATTTAVKSVKTAQQEERPDDQRGRVQGCQDHFGDPVLLLLKGAVQHLVGEQEDDHIEQQKEHQRRNGGAEAAGCLPATEGLCVDLDFAARGSREFR